MKNIILITLMAGALAIGGCSQADSSIPAGSNGSSPAKAEWGEYGSDPVLDHNYDACEDGNKKACRELFFQSPSNSEYETLGINNEWPNEEERDEIINPSTAESTVYEEAEGDTSSTELGDDTYLNALAEDCEDRDAIACEELYMYSPEGSAYEELAIERGGDQSSYYPNYSGEEPGYEPW